MSRLPQTAFDVQRAVTHGEQCAECAEPFRRPYETPTLCNSCWHKTEDRTGFLKANRNDEQSVAAAKRNRKKA